METCLLSNAINVEGLLPKDKIKIMTHKMPFLKLMSISCRQFIRNCSTKSVGKKCLETVCRSGQIGGRPCRGKMHDTILDWEHNLPNDDLALSDLHSRLNSIFLNKFN